MSGWLHGCMSGCMGGWVDAWAGAWMHEWVGAYMSGCMGRLTRRAVCLGFAFCSVFIQYVVLSACSRVNRNRNVIPSKYELVVITVQLYLSALNLRSCHPNSSIRNSKLFRTSFCVCCDGTLTAQPHDASLGLSSRVPEQGKRWMSEFLKRAPLEPT